MKDWRTHCFDYIGGIANVAGAAWDTLTGW